MIYIYALICPESGSPRYVGKTKYIRTRLATHIYKAKGFHTNNHCANWIRSLLAKGLKPDIVVINELPNDGDWQAAESEAIAAYRAAGHDLTNSTSGGDGFHDLPTEILAKTVAAVRLRMSDPVKRAEFIRKTGDARNTPQVRKKQSDSSKARWADPKIRAMLIDSMNTHEAIANRSEAAKLTNANAEYAANHSAKAKEIWNRPERKEEASRRSLKAWADPEITKRRVDSIKATYSTDEMKERVTATNREINSRPEVKAAKSVRMKSEWAKPDVRAKRIAAYGPETRAKMAASAKARFSKPGSKSYLSSPEARVRLSESAKRRATPAYRAMMADKKREWWRKRKSK